MHRNKTFHQNVVPSNMRKVVQEFGRSNKNLALWLWKKLNSFRQSFTECRARPRVRGRVQNWILAARYGTLGQISRQDRQWGTFTTCFHLNLVTVNRYTYKSVYLNISVSIELIILKFNENVLTSYWRFCIIYPRSWRVTRTRTR